MPTSFRPVLVIDDGDDENIDDKSILYSNRICGMGSQEMGSYWEPHLTKYICNIAVAPIWKHHDT